MAIELTPLGFQKPDGNELVRNGDNAIAANAQKSQDLIAAAQAGALEISGRVDEVETATAEQQAQLAAAQAADLALAGRIGVAEAALNAGAGGPGLSADPDRPGLFYFAGPSISPDPVTPGLFIF
ncbi:hypothetical protein PP637_gp28 [Arthrobacter phage Persistence]|uniref:Uncharacterized protein n=1 Tax=Arthrobacter phage Persistence TaxID=2836007 RepID=A0A8F3IIB6_9CAUD|nr:hypothetical protein PP637_gp28 [Arthrobacter phage Persistence]QWY79658.1 hypothetical protein SEA_PERSISTENCE_28 [Arthrobacter phage Persistence]